MVQDPRTSGTPTVSYDEWRLAVEKGLSGRPFSKLVTGTHESIAIDPLYVPSSWPHNGDPGGWPGLPPYRRGIEPLRRGWQIAQEHGLPEPEQSAAAVAADVEAGVHTVWLRCDRAVRSAAGVEHLAGDGLVVDRFADLSIVLEPVNLERVAVVIDAGASAVAAAASLVAVARDRGADLRQLSGGVVFDPLATLVREGVLPSGVNAAYAQLAQLLTWSAENTPQLRMLSVDVTPYHGAGANAVQDLAFALSAGVEGLRRLENLDVDAGTATSQLRMILPVGRDLFMEIAKLRALRVLWSEVERQCGIGRPPRMAVHARSSHYNLSQRDPWVNLLRGTTSTLAAVVGGADSVAVAPLDMAIGLPDQFSAHLATNTQHLLAEESHLGRVMDAAGGSWYVERLTDELAASAWELFQEIEGGGGMLHELTSGRLHERIDGVHRERVRAVATRRDAITGVSEFPNVRETPVVARGIDREALRSSLAERREDEPVALPDTISGEWFESVVAAVQGGVSWQTVVAAVGQDGQPLSATVLPQRRLAQPFEVLRDACDHHRETTGSRPKVFLANWGPIPQHRARAEFSSNFFEAGGFEAETNDGFTSVEAAVAAFQSSAAEVVVLCSSDDVYPEVVGPLTARLKAAGASVVVLAGRPGDREAEYRDAGVDRFIFLGCDVLETLETILRELGVVS